MTDEQLDEAIDLRRADARLAVHHVVEGEMELATNVVGTGEPPAVGGEHGVVQDGDGGLGLLTDLENVEGLGAIGIDYSVGVDATDSFGRADHDRGSGECLAGPAARDMVLPDAEVRLLEKGHVLTCAIDGVISVLALCRQPTPASALVVKNLRYGDSREPTGFRSQHPLDPVAPLGGVHSRRHRRCGRPRCAAGPPDATWQSAVDL